MAGVAQVELAAAREGLAVRPERVGSTQSNMSMPRCTAPTMSAGCADAHQVARPVGRQHAAGRIEHAEHRPAGPRRPPGRPWRSRRSRSPSAPRRLSAAGRDRCRPARCRTGRSPAGRRRRACSARPSASTAAWRRRPASCVDRQRVHSSSAMAMSAPSRCWISIERSGVSTWAEPSMCERKVTPSSSILRRSLERHDLEAAGVGQDRPRPAHEPVQAAQPRDALGARAAASGGRCCPARSRRRSRRPTAAVIALTVPPVPTGMKAGVSTVPCAVVMRPRRAAPSVPSSRRQKAHRRIKQHASP